MAPGGSEIRTILVVDDEPALLRLMEYLLHRQGYRILTAANGEDALELVRTERPDLVVLDVMMPRMDGYEVAAAIRHDREIASTPIVILTAKAQDQDIERGLAAAVDAYITKPFEPARLSDTVANLLAGERMRRKNEDVLKPTTMTAG